LEREREIEGVTTVSDEESEVEIMKIHIFERVFLADFTNENLGACSTYISAAKGSRVE
jgi:hypothetical protein